MLKAVMRACFSFGEKFYSLSQIVEATGAERKATRHRLRKLETAGLVTRVRTSETPAQRGRPVMEISYRNTNLLAKRLGGPAGRPVSTLNGWDRMWQAVRVLRRFTRTDLAQICGQSIPNVKVFTTAYRQAGYLRCLGRPGTRNVTWMLVKD